VTKGGAGKAAVAIVGVGVKAPGGNTIADLWDTLLAGKASAEVFRDDRLPAGADMLVSRVEGFDAAEYCNAVEIRRLDRSHLLAIAAAQDAIDALAGALPPPERRAVVCGVGFGATATYEFQYGRLLEGGVRALSPLVIPMVMPNGAAAHLSLRFQLQGPCHTISSACASGATAIAEGVELLRRGAADLVLAGGVDSMVNYNAMVSFMRLDAMSRNVAAPEVASRPFDVDRDGFVMAEGAGFVVLERGDDANELGHEVLGYVRGAGSCADAFHLVAPSENGEGALRCMRLALADADASPREINHVNAHGTSTMLNDLAEATAISALFGDDAAPVTAVKGSTGHMIGGSGAVEAIVTLWSLRAGVVPAVSGHTELDPKMSIDVVSGAPRPIAEGYGLTNSFGFGGANTSLVLSAT